MSAPDGLTHVIPALVPVATSTPVHARTSAPPAAALTTAPLAIHARISNLLLSQSLGTPEVNRTFFNIDDDDFDLTVVEPAVVVKGKGKAKGGPCTKAKAGAATPEAKPSCWNAATNSKVNSTWHKLGLNASYWCPMFHGDVHVTVETVTR
ncbi:hypothetical protein FRC10_011987, partial [Ceratobasidium sp. 414]